MHSKNERKQKRIYKMLIDFSVYQKHKKKKNSERYKVVHVLAELNETS